MSSLLQQTSFETQDESCFTRVFDAATRHDLLAEDSEAWRAVCGVLLTIVSVGLLLAIGAVLLAR
jgi:hypothetical protein